MPSATMERPRWSWPQNGSNLREWRRDRQSPSSCHVMGLGRRQSVRNGLTEPTREITSQILSTAPAWSLGRRAIEHTLSTFHFSLDVRQTARGRGVLGQGCAVKGLRRRRLKVTSKYGFCPDSPTSPHFRFILLFLIGNSRPYLCIKIDVFYFSISMTKY